MTFKNKYTLILSIFLILMIIMPITNERFLDNKNTIHFLSKIEAVNVFDKNMDYHKLHDIEVYSRTNGRVELDLTPEDRIQELKIIYHSKLNEFNQEEKDAIFELTKITTIPDVKWKFIKINDGIDWNYPYTLADVIVLPKSKVESMVNAVKNKDRAMIKTHVNTLTHEFMHVLQRKYQGLFNIFYIKNWGFTKPTRILNDEWVQKYWITNPDTIDENWLWDINQFKKDKKPEYIWTRFLIDPENYDQKIKIAIRVSKIKNGDYRVNLNNGKPVYKNLIFEKSFNKRFFNLGQIYHPNEIFANFVADSHNLKFMYPKDYKEIHEFLNNILKLK